MGYTLRIGNAYMDFDKEYNYLKIDAEAKTLPNAPAFGEPTDNSNSRWPSYTAWHDFTKFAGLYDLFFNKEREDPECLLKEHPGYTVITKEHQKEINRLYKLFYIKYPNCKAGFSPNATDFADDPNWPIENSYAVRFEWLKFWIDWALENCEIPIFYNS